MLFDKSGQHVGNDSEAIQAGRDVIIGNNTQDVIAICNLVIDTRFSALQQKALQEARQRANEFGTQITNKLNVEIDEKIEAKLADPDIQFAISEATVIVARKGDKVKSNLLQEIILSKIKNEDEEKDLLIDHAIEISKRLTTSEIKLLTFIYFFRRIYKELNSFNLSSIISDYQNSIIHPSISLEECYSAYKNFYSIENSPLLRRIIGDFNTITPVKKHLLEIKGCLKNDSSYVLTFKQLISERTGFNIDTEESFQYHFPTLKLILDYFDIANIEEFNYFVINELGEIIAENYLNAQGGLN